jgi:hypothetical protein
MKQVIVICTLPAAGESRHPTLSAAMTPKALRRSIISGSIPVVVREHFVYDQSMDAERDGDIAVARIAAAIGELARARMLFCLMDGHARTSTELAAVAQVSPSTASVHLGRSIRAREASLLQPRRTGCSECTGRAKRPGRRLARQVHAEHPEPITSRKNLLRSHRGNGGRIAPRSLQHLGVAVTRHRQRIRRHVKRNKGTRITRHRHHRNQSATPPVRLRMSGLE